MKNRIIKVAIVAFLLFGLFISTNVGFQEIYSLPEGFVASYDEVSSSNQNKKFGSLVSTKLEKSVYNTSSGMQKEDVIVFKLFGFIPSRKAAKQDPVNALRSE